MSYYRKLGLAFYFFLERLTLFRFQHKLILANESLACKESRWKKGKY